MKAKIPSAVRFKVWDKYIGMERAIDKCFCCNANIIQKETFECGHVKAESEGGETIIDNLRPVCRNCNTSMGTKNMIEFMRQYGFEFRSDFNGKVVTSLEKILNITMLQPPVQPKIRMTRTSILKKLKQNLHQLENNKLKQFLSQFDTVLLKQWNEDYRVSVFGGKNELIQSLLYSKKLNNINRYKYELYIKTILDKLSIFTLKSLCNHFHLTKIDSKFNMIQDIIKSKFMYELFELN